jgi:hypothetical protein
MHLEFILQRLLQSCNMIFRQLTRITGAVHLQVLCVRGSACFVLALGMCCVQDMVQGTRNPIDCNYEVHRQL